MSKGSDLSAVRVSIRRAFIEALIGQKSTSVQSLVFKKSKFTTVAAKTWAKNHGFRNKKVDITTNSIRLRQFDPGKCKDNSFRTKSLTTGVSVVLCKKK